MKQTNGMKWFKMKTKSQPFNRRKSKNLVIDFSFNFISFFVSHRWVNWYFIALRWSFSLTIPCICAFVLHFSNRMFFFWLRCFGFQSSISSAFDRFLADDELWTDRLFPVWKWMPIFALFMTLFSFLLSFFQIHLNLYNYASLEINWIFLSSS